MRRLLLSIFTLGFFLGMLTGCQNFFCHTAGVCDCDHDDDPCAHRAPWVRGYAPAGPVKLTTSLASEKLVVSIALRNVKMAFDTAPATLSQST